MKGALSRFIGSILLLLMIGLIGMVYVYYSGGSQIPAKGQQFSIEEGTDKKIVYDVDTRFSNITLKAGGGKLADGKFDSDRQLFFSKGVVDGLYRVSIKEDNKFSAMQKIVSDLNFTISNPQSKDIFIKNFYGNVDVDLKGANYDNIVVYKAKGDTSISVSDIPSQSTISVLGGRGNTILKIPDGVGVEVKSTQYLGSIQGLENADVVEDGKVGSLWLRTTGFDSMPKKIYIKFKVLIGNLVFEKEGGVANATPQLPPATNPTPAPAPQVVPAPAPVDAQVTGTKNTGTVDPGEALIQEALTPIMSGDGKEEIKTAPTADKKKVKK